MGNKNTRLIQALISIYQEDLDKMEVRDLNSTPDNPVSISAEYFDEIMRIKGWGIKDVSKFFGVQERQMRNIIKNNERNSYYNYALLGLPGKVSKTK